MIGLADTLELVLREGGFLQGKDFQILIFGSLLNTLYNCNTSDLDLTIMFDDEVKDVDCDHEVVLREARKILEK